MTSASPRPAMPRTVRVLGWVGALLFWVVLQTLVFLGVQTADALLVAVLFVAAPAIGAAQLALVDGVRIERLPAYWGSIAALWFLGSAAWLVGTRSGGPAAIGLAPLPASSLVLWSAGLTAGALLIILAFRQLAVSLGVEETPLLRDLLPRTVREKRVFALLSVAAGAGEELAYRGYSIPVLASLLGLPAAAVCTSVVFGALHAYQGFLGVVRTALMGGMLAWGYLASGSLWPAIVAHTAIDLIAGVLLGERLLPPERAVGVEGAPRSNQLER